MNRGVVSHYAKVLGVGFCTIVRCLLVVADGCLWAALCLCLVGGRSAEEDMSDESSDDDFDLGDR